MNLAIQVKTRFPILTCLTVNTSVASCAVAGVLIDEILTRPESAGAAVTVVDICSNTRMDISPGVSAQNWYHSVFTWVRMLRVGEVTDVLISHFSPSHPGTHTQ